MPFWKNVGSRPKKPGQLQLASTSIQKVARPSFMSIPQVPTAGLLRICLALSGLSGATGVICLALSAHASASSSLATAGQMLLAHAPLFIGVGILSQIRRISFLPVVAVCLTLGLALFSGDLISRAFFEQRFFPMSAPIGGLLIILAWLTLALSALRVKPK
jgi:uncharacterized membrane protein YgdD (TMEM256/DUF423 family)